MTSILWTAARRWSGAVMFTWVVSHGVVFGEDAGGVHQRAAEWRGVERALRLVTLDPRWRVALIEPDLAPDPELIARLDAFIVRENDGRFRPVIFINRRSAILQRATAGIALAVEELAAVIHHEAEHLAGGSEIDAREAERAFLQSLVGGGQACAGPDRAFRP